MRILYITTAGGTMNFFVPLIKELIDDGNTVDIATNEFNGDSCVPDYYRQVGCHIFQISCVRTPLNTGNLSAINEIRRIVKNGKYDIVHCHTPIASACTRIACRPLRKNGLKVIYTAHGFHFYSGAPLKNWILYYPIEKLCSRWTDCLITINIEDNERAKQNFHCKDIIFVPGVGVDVGKFEAPELKRSDVRKELGIDESELLIVSIGELNENKNQSVIIRAIAKSNNPKVHYAIAGKGALETKLKELSCSLGIANQVHILGYRKDVPSLYKAADVCAFPSIREGQGIAAIEGMASGLPLIASDNRGMRGTLVDEINAVICKYNDVDAFAEGINKLAGDPVLRKKMGDRNRMLSKNFDISVVNSQMKEIYSRVTR